MVKNLNAILQQAGDAVTAVRSLERFLLFFFLFFFFPLGMEGGGGDPESIMWGITIKPRE